MPDPHTLSRTQKIGSVAGVLLLGFALAYRFLPDLMVGGDAVPAASQGVPDVRAGAPMGFPKASSTGTEPEFSEALSGPPISLASSKVISTYRRSANAPLSEQLAQWLQQGDQAASEGKLVGVEDSATSWYAKVLDADNDNRAARAGLAEVTRKLASQAEAALEDGDGERAQKTLVLLQDVPRADTTVARISKQLQVFQKVTPLLGEAANLLQGQNVSEDNRARARSLYEQILKLDPTNEVARQGMLNIQRFWLDQALAAVAENHFDDADLALVRAAELAPASHGLQNTRSRVEGMREMRAGHLLAQARSALDSGNLPLARKLADQAVAISPSVRDLDAFEADYQNARLYGGYQAGQKFQDRFVDRAGQGPRMVVLPIGHFRMGSPEQGSHGHDAERPQHDVTLSRGIALAGTEITVAQFGDFVQATGYRTDADRLGGATVYDLSSGRMRDEGGADWQRDFAGHRAESNAPVVNVSWNDAVAYARWLSERTGHTYRLPSEAEFEYALRGGTTSRYWWGDGSPQKEVENLTGDRDRARNGRRWIRAFTNYRDGFWGPAPVASFLANPFGLHDMNGNVSEWVADCWHDNYTRAPDDGSAWINPGCGTRVVRGASWGSAPEQARSSFRVAADASTRSGRVGFRVVRELSGP